MNLKKNKSGFTLLEIIIVIIIVGVLASLALPRFFKTVEYSRSTEALANISAIRQSMERCSLQKGNTFVGCTFATIDYADPSANPNSHFGYAIVSQTATAYNIVATRSTFEGGIVTDTITQTFDTALTPQVRRDGAGSFAGVKNY